MRDVIDPKGCGRKKNGDDRDEVVGIKNPTPSQIRAPERNVMWRIPSPPIYGGPFRQTEHDESMYGWTARAEKRIQK